MRILIAEDDRVTNKLLTTQLKSCGHEVTSVHDGEAAWTALEGENSYDIAILDWMMPKMSGLDVCRAIKSMPGESYIYIIMLTIRDRSEDIVQALDAGADDYVTKPFNRSELKARVRAGERIRHLESGLKEKITELEQALAHVKQLQGIIPICAWCKKVRSDDDYWGSVESYVSHHTQAEFSHSICPECKAAITPKKEKAVF